MGGAHRKKTSTSGIIVAAGQISNELDTTSYSTILQDISNMRAGDCVASSTLEVLKLPILRSEIKISGGKTGLEKEALEYVNYTFDNLQIDKYRENGLRYLLEHLLLALDYGVILFEPIWQIEKYKEYTTRRLLYLSPIRPETISDWLFDEDMEFVGIKQRRYSTNYSYTTIQIPAESLFVFTFGEEFYDVRGKPILRKARTAWKYKERIMNSMARSIARGAGIPKIKLGQMADENTQDIAHTIGRTIGNSDNSYIITQDGVMDVELMALQNQANSLEYLQYLDRQMLFNTLSQFMTAGIGENGSRAAAGELKTPYELRINDIADLVEESLNRLIILIIKESYLFGTLSNYSYPKAKLNMPVNTSLDEIATSIQKLASVNAIKFTEEDEKYLRNIFSLPEKMSVENKTKMFELEFKPTPKNFILEDVKNFYKGHQELVDKEIELIYKDILKNIIEFVKKGKEVRRDKEKINEYVDRLNKLYMQAVTKGRIDIQGEMAKVNIQFDMQFENNRQKKKIVRQVKTLFYDTEQVAENIVENATKKQLAQGLENLLMIKLGDGMKTLRRSLSATIMDGYTEGRNDVIKQAGDYILYTYTVALEDIEHVCEACMPLDGLEMTKSEAEAHGLRIEENGRLNPDCLGGDNCRCLLIPTSQRRI